jgi:hypothetical protein
MGLLTIECVVLEKHDFDLATFTVDFVRAALTGLAVLTNTAVVERFCLAVLIVTRPDFISTALGTMLLLAQG